MNPVIKDFDDLDELYRRRGIKLTDLKNSSNHFDKWHKARGLPEHDSDGKHKGGSQIFYRQYREAPDGEAQRPLYVNLWHWLLKVSEIIEWAEKPGKRSKAMPLFNQFIDELKVPERTPEALAQGRKNYEAKVGSILPEEHWEELKQQLIDDSKAKEVCMAFAKKMIEDFGEIIPGREDLGKVLIIGMKVDC